MFQKPKITPRPATLGYLKSPSLSLSPNVSAIITPALPLCQKNLREVVEEYIYILGFSKTENSNILQNGTSQDAFAKQQRERH
jgi:hypothetical protein